MTDPGSHPNRVPLLETLYSRQRGLLERLRVHQHNLDLLLLQQAKHGIDVPLRLLNEIEEQQRETLAIETELAGLDRKISTLMERAPSVSSSEPEVPNNRLGIWFKNEGDEYEVVAPYPFIGSTNIATPDKRMQTIGRFAGGFEVLSVMQTGQQGLTVSFLRHGRRISPVLDKQNRKILLPLGPHAIINGLATNWLQQEKLEDITPERVAEGLWALISPGRPQRSIMYLDYPQGTRDGIMTSRITYDGGFELCVVQPPQGTPLRVWFYIRDWAVAPMIHESLRALAFPPMPPGQSSSSSGPETTQKTEEVDIQSTRRALVERLDIEEFRTLCADLAVSYDGLRGEGQEAKARELIAYLQRREQIGKLFEYLNKIRPDISFA